MWLSTIHSLIMHDWVACSPRKEGLYQTNCSSVPLLVCAFDIQPMSLVSSSRRRYPEGRTKLACSFSPFTLHHFPTFLLSLFSPSILRAAPALLVDQFPSSLTAITYSFFRFFRTCVHAFLNLSLPSLCTTLSRSTPESSSISAKQEKIKNKKIVDWCQCQLY